MFKKKHRLSKTKDVKRAVVKGRNFFSPVLTVKCYFSEKKRFTVVVSTKVSKKAVVRNRIKRIIREFLRKNMGKIKTGDYAILIKPKAVQIPESELLENLEITLKKGRLL